MKHRELHMDYSSISQVREYQLITIKALQENDLPPKSLRIYKLAVPVPRMTRPSNIISE
jgi:hypothetical protein